MRQSGGSARGRIRAITRRRRPVSGTFWTLLLARYQLLLLRQKTVFTCFLARFASPMLTYCTYPDTVCEFRTLA